MYAKEFEDKLKELSILRGWNIRVERPMIIWRQSRLTQYSEKSIMFGLERMKSEDNFDERVLIYHIKQHHNRGKTGDLDNLEMSQYLESQRAQTPGFDKMKSECWQFIGKCMSNMGVSKSLQEDIDSKAWHEEMNEKYPDMGFGEEG